MAGWQFFLIKPSMFSSSPSKEIVVPRILNVKETSGASNQ
jgi:hypothetical protein